MERGQIAAKAHKDKGWDHHDNDQNVPCFFDPEFVDEGCGESAEKQCGQRRAQGSDKNLLHGQVDDQAYNETEDEGDRCAEGAQQKNEKVFAFHEVGPAQGQGHGEFVPVVVAVIAEAAERTDHDQNGVDSSENADRGHAKGHKNIQHHEHSQYSEISAQAEKFFDD